MLRDRQIATGWHRPSGSTKFHYFIDGVSLCNRLWMGHISDLDERLDDHPESCKVCKRCKLRVVEHYATDPEGQKAK